MAKFLINDGYTLDGHFDGRNNGLPNCHFKYRAAPPASVYDYQQAIGRATSGEDQMKAVCELLTPRNGQPRLLSWDIDGESDKSPVAAICAATLRQLPPPLLNFFTNVVCSYTAGKQADDAKN